MRILFARSQSTAGTAGTSYYNPTTLKTVAGEINAQAPWPVACNITSMRINLAASQGAASRVFTIRKAGSDTAHTLTFTGATVTGTITTAVAWAEGDLISVKEVITGSPASLGSTGLELILEYEPTTAAQAAYVWGTHTCNVGASMRNPLFTPRDVFANVSEGTVQNIAAVAGDITKWFVIIPADSADGAGTITCYIVRNGVRQDGTGGTVDTAIQFTNATTWATPLSRSIALPKDRLDTFSMEIVHAGASTFAAAVAVGIQCTADTAAEAECFFYDSTTVSNSATAYSNGPSPLWNATDSATAIAVGPSSFSLTKPVCKLLDAAPGASKDYTFTQRKNAGDPGGGTSVTITGAATQTGEDASSAFVTYDAGDTFTTKSVPTGTPTAGKVSWAYVLTVLAAEIRGSVVFGVTTTVTATRAAAFGLDGNTNVHGVVGQLKVFGDVAVTGVTTLEDTITERGRTTPMGAWESYTPTWTNVTVGNGTVTAKCSKVGTTVNFAVLLVFGSTTAITGNAAVSTPSGFSAVAGAVSHGRVMTRDVSAGAYYAGLSVTVSSGVIGLYTENSSPSAKGMVPITATAPFTWATGDQLFLGGTYDET